jgi:CBS domain-containing protein
MQVTVRDLMTSQPLTISEQVTVEEATRTILDRAVSELYVVDDSGRLLGTVSDFALLKARILSSDSQEPVTVVMSRNMVLLNPNMRLDEVAGYFRESCHSQLAVMEGGRVIGRLSRRDVLRALVVLEEIALNSNSGDCQADVWGLEPVLAADGTARVHRVEASEQSIPRQPSGLRQLHESGHPATATTLGTMNVR